MRTSKEEIQAKDKMIEIDIATYELIEALPKRIGKLFVDNQGFLLRIVDKKFKGKCFYGEVVHAKFHLKDTIDELNDLRSFLQEHKKLDKKLETLFSKLFLLLEVKDG